MNNSQWVEVGVFGRVVVLALICFATACGGVGVNQPNLSTELPQGDNEAAQAHNERGRILLEAGEFEEALDALNLALKLNPEHEEALHHRAIVQIKRRKFFKALADFSMVLEVAGEDPVIYYNLGNTYVRVARLQQAIKAYKRSLAL